MRPSRREFVVLMSAALSGGAALAAPNPGRWARFKARFVTDDGRVADTGNGGVSHTESQGYGLLFAEAAGDRAAFERIWRWTDATLARRDLRLFSWRYDPKSERAVADRNNATDGDLLIAWALQRGAKRWREPAYATASAEIAAAIAANLVVEGPSGPVLLPGLEGFRTAEALTLNPSYYVWPALDALAAADASGPWIRLIAAGEDLMVKARFGAHGLPSDWVTQDGAGGVGPAAGWPPRFGYDAVRTPLYLAWSGRQALVQPFRDYWTTFVAAGASPPAWVDVLSGEVAPYAASPGLQALARSTCGLPPASRPAEEDYYSAALGDLTALAAGPARRAH